MGEGNISRILTYHFDCTRSDMPGLSCTDRDYVYVPPCTMLEGGTWMTWYRYDRLYSQVEDTCDFPDEVLDCSGGMDITDVVEKVLETLGVSWSQTCNGHGAMWIEIPSGNHSNLQGISGLCGLVDEWLEDSPDLEAPAPEHFNKHLCNDGSPNPDYVEMTVRHRPFSIPQTIAEYSKSIGLPVSEDYIVSDLAPASSKVRAPGKVVFTDTGATNHSVQAMLLWLQNDKDYYNRTFVNSMATRKNLKQAYYHETRVRDYPFVQDLWEELFDLHNALVEGRNV